MFHVQWTLCPSGFPSVEAQDGKQTKAAGTLHDLGQVMGPLPPGSALHTGILAQVNHPQAGAGGERVTCGFLELGVLSDRRPPPRTRHTPGTGNRQTHPFNAIAQLSRPHVPKTELFFFSTNNAALS